MTSRSFRDGLPTLESVLSRRTLPPVCLYNYYIIMRDRLHMEEVLDFYLDVQHHELLWRRYIKTMRRSGYLTEDDLADGFQSPRVLSRLSQLNDEKKPMSPSLLTADTALKKQKELAPPTPTPGRIHEEGLSFSDDGYDDEKRPVPELRFSSLSGSEGVPLERPPIDEQDAPSRLDRKARLNRQDLTDSAQRIMIRYLVPSASKELTQLPHQLKTDMRRQIEDNGRDDPLVFAEGKQYALEYMRRNAYPKFLRIKVWGNVTLMQQMLRLVLGLVALLAGLSTAFSLIFLGYPQWGVRFWVCVPFGFYLLYGLP